MNLSYLLRFTTCNRGYLIHFNSNIQFHSLHCKILVLFSCQLSAFIIASAESFFEVRSAKRIISFFSEKLKLNNMICSKYRTRSLNGKRNCLENDKKFVLLPIIKIYLCTFVSKIELGFHSLKRLMYFC